MVNAKFPSAASHQAERTAQSSTGFDMLLAEAGRRQTFDGTVDRQSQNRDDSERNRRSTNESRSETQPVRRNEPRAEDVTSTAGTAAIYEQNASTEVNDSNEVPAIDETQAVENVAEIIQVPAEVVAEWLQELDLTAQDLTDTQTVAKILQHALDAESPAELLTDPEFPELYKAVNEAIAELVVNANPKATVNNEAVNLLAEDLESLEADIEDGEIVVTNKNEISANNTETQTVTQTTITQADQPQISESAPEITDANLLAADDEAIVHESQSATPAFNIEPVAVKVEHTVQQTAPQQPVNTTDVIQQIMNQVKLTTTGGQFNEIRMTLRPETLGDIVLRVITQNGIVMAQFEAESQRVKEALEADFNLLRDALQEHGIKFSELSVSVRQDENERMNQFERARQKSRHRAESIEEVPEEQVEISHHNGVIDLTA